MKRITGLLAAALANFWPGGGVQPPAEVNRELGRTRAERPNARRNARKNNRATRR